MHGCQRGSADVEDPRLVEIAVLDVKYVVVLVPTDVHIEGISIFVLVNCANIVASLLVTHGQQQP